MLVLQKSYLFYKTEDNEFVDNGYPSPICKHLLQFFASFIDWLPNESKMKFLEQFTQQICTYSWSSISLLFVCIAISNLNIGLSNLSSVFIKNVCQILQCSLTTHEPLMRSSIQTFLLHSLVKHTKSFDLASLNDFVDALNVFSIKECIQYNNSSWKLITNWFKQIDSNTLFQFVETEFNKFIDIEINNDYSIQIKSNKLAKLVLIVSELDQVQLRLVEQLVEKLKNSNRNLYMSTERIEKCLLMFNFMISFVTKTELKSFKLVKMIYEECSHSVLDYIMRRVNETNLYFNKLNLYFEILENILKFNIEFVKSKLIKQYS